MMSVDLASKSTAKSNEKLVNQKYAVPLYLGCPLATECFFLIFLMFFLWEVRKNKGKLRKYQLAQFKNIRPILLFLLAARRLMQSYLHMYQVQ